MARVCDENARCAVRGHQRTNGNFTLLVFLCFDPYRLLLGRGRDARMCRDFVDGRHGKGV